jgi:signal transduction histidine kinase
MVSVPLQVADAGTGCLLLGCGAVTWWRRSNSWVGPIMLLASGCWFAGDVLGAALFWHRGPMVQLHISYPTGRLRRPLSMLTVALAYVVAALEWFADNPWLTAGLSGLVIVAALDVYARTSGRTRKAGGPALLAALAFAAVLGLSSANQILDWGADRPVLYAYYAVVSSVVLLLTADLLWGRWTDATVADFVTQLGSGGKPAGLRGELSRALGDPSLVLGFWAPERQCYLNEAGQPIDAVDGQVATHIDDDGAPAALLAYDPVLVDDPALVEGVVAAVRIAVANMRMRGEIEQRVHALEAARRRVVEAADEQRRVLAIELAAGAGARLSQLGECLERADVPELIAELHEARDELQAFAQGVRPAALDSGGLGAALPRLAARAGVPVELEVDPTRCPPAVEASLYFICAEGLSNVDKHARATRAWVNVRVEGDDVVVHIRDDGIGGADPHGSGLRGLIDRVEALGGRLTVQDGPVGTTLLAHVPLYGERPR